MEGFCHLRSTPGVLLASNWHWSAALSTALCAVIKDHRKGEEREEGREGGKEGRKEGR